MFDHVLVSLDYSKLSEKALPFALHILPEDGRLTLLTAIESVPNPAVYPGEGILAYDQANVEKAQNELQQHAEDYLDRVVSSLPKPLPEIEQIVQAGSPADVIVDFALNAGVKAIVMSTHGRTGISRWLMGSVTQKVLNAAPCPVIVIPSKALQD